MGERINECGPRTADGIGQAFEAVRGEGEPSTNGETNKRMRTADGKMDGRRWTVERLQTADGVGQAFEAVRGEGQTVNEWGNESTNADRGRRTA